MHRVPSQPLTTVAAGLCLALLGHGAGWAGTADRVIVEFHEPETRERVGADDGVGHQFRQDLSRLFELDQRTANSLIEHEFQDCLDGAVLSLDSAAAEPLRALPYVRAIHEDAPVHFLVEDAADITQARAISAPYLGIDGSGVRVGVIDTGVDYRHPDFGGEIGEDNPVVLVRDYTGADGDGIDTNGHGTHIAGTIAARFNNPGIAPGASIYSYRTSADMNSLLSVVLQAMEDAYGDGVDVLNMSLAAPPLENSPINTCAEWLFDQGMLVVASTGNSGRNFDIAAPAMSPRVLAVGASTKQGELAAFSSRGPVRGSIRPKPDLVAPGESILAQNIGGSGLVALSGTSMSTPVVSGLAALYKQYRPHATPAEIMAALSQGAVPLLDAGGEPLPFFDQGFGEARLLNSFEQQTWVFPSAFTLGLVTAETPAQQTQTLIVGNHRAEPATCAIDTELPQGVQVIDLPESISVPAAAEAGAGSTTIEVNFELDFDALQPRVSLLNPDTLQLIFDCQGDSQPDQLAVRGTVMRQFSVDFDFGPDVASVMLLEVDPGVNGGIRQSDLFEFDEASRVNGFALQSNPVQFLALIRRQNSRPLLAITPVLEPEDGQTIQFGATGVRHLTPQFRGSDEQLHPIPLDRFVTFMFQFDETSGTLYERLSLEGSQGLDVALAPGTAIEMAGAWLSYSPDGPEPELDVYSYLVRIDHQTGSLPVVDSHADYLTRRYRIENDENEVGLRLARIGIGTPQFREAYANGSVFLCPGTDTDFSVSGDFSLNLHAQPIAGSQPGLMNYFALTEAGSNDLACGLTAPFGQELFASDQLRLVTAGLYDNAAGQSLQYPHISMLYSDRQFPNRLPALTNPALSEIARTVESLPHPKLLFRNASGGWGVAGYFYTPWDDLLPGAVTFRRIDSDGNEVRQLQLPNFQRNLPFSDRVLDPLVGEADPLLPGESVEAIFEGFRVGDQRGRASYRYEFASNTLYTLNSIALNRLVTRRPESDGMPDDRGYSMRLNQSRGGEVFFQILGTGVGPDHEQDDLPGVSNADQVTVDIAPWATNSGEPDWQPLELTGITGLGPYQGKLGPEVNAKIPTGLAVGLYQLRITVEDDGGNRMTFRAEPAFKIEPASPVIFQDRFSRPPNNQ